MKEIPRFTENREDQAFERLMQRVPGFEPDPPEMEIVQRELDKARIRKVKKGDTDQERTGAQRNQNRAWK